MTQSAKTLLACVCGLAATLGTTGCTSTGVAARQSQPAARPAAAQQGVIVRAQSITEHEEGAPHGLGMARNAQSLNHAINPLHIGQPHLPYTKLGTAIDNKLHNTRVSYHDNSTPVCGGTGAPGDPMCPTCPTYGAGGPMGGHFGGPFAGGCPTGQCGTACGGRCVRNYHSYRVEQPENLVYPQQNAVGGAVVYPYYTHKGPSDFFRQ